MIPTFVALTLVPDGQWGPTTMTPRALANLVDTRLATLPRVRARFQYSYERKAVGTGRIFCMVAVARPGAFRLDVPNVDENRKFVIEREVWISDGKRFATAMNREPMASEARARPATPLRPLNTWFIDFSRTILSGLGRPSHPFANFVADATAKGFKVTTNLRQIRANGRLYKQYRLLATKGAIRYETVIDGHFGLPTSIVNFVGPVDNTRWSAVAWEFPKTALKPEETAFRRPAPAPKRAPTPRRPKASPSR